MIAGNSASYYRNLAEGERRAWVAGKLAKAPAPWREKIRKRHAGMAPGLADDWLASISSGLGAIRVPVTMSDAELCDLSVRLASECLSIGAETNKQGALMLASALRARMAKHVERYGIAPPAPERITANGKRAGVSDAGAIARMSCPHWWRRRLREAQGRAIEHKAIELGYVHRHAERYASDVAVGRRTQQRTRNAAALAGTIATNRDTAQEFTLADLAEKSVANPRIRRGELMTRIAGFESVARGLGHAGEFVTLTAPSKYHATLAGGAANPKWQGATPRDTAGYLGRLWSRLRAALARAGAAVYGFRIAEPHHDATPHWHLLLFMAAESVAPFREIFARYALAEDGEEPGAAVNRVRFVAIDWARGSAAGYVAKYVAKNIDGGGYQVQGDTEGGPGELFPGARVDAWASTWGIRQFQQIGGPPVGVWRELRRIEADAAHPPTLAAARDAADCGPIRGGVSGMAAIAWANFVGIMGGPMAPRAAHPLRVEKSGDGERLRYATGEIESAPPGRYGEIRAGAVYGVRDLASGKVFAAVHYAWEIAFRPRAVAVEYSRVPLLPVTGATWRAYGAPSARDADGFELAGNAGPWSPVNNCTGGGDGFTGKGLEAEIQDHERIGWADSLDAGAGIPRVLDGCCRDPGRDGDENPPTRGAA